MKLSILLLFICSLTACGKKYDSKDFAKVAAQSGACAEAETYFHDIVQKSYEETGSIPEKKAAISAYKESLNSLNIKNTDKTFLIKAFSILYSQIENLVNNAKSKEKGLKALRELELGFFEDEKLQKDYTKSVESFTSLSKKFISTCKAPDEKISAEDEVSSLSRSRSPFFENLKRKTQNLSQYGALKSFAVAYQSCESITQRDLTSQSESSKGISVVGKHSSGRGKRREITNITRLRRTHPYIKHYRKPASNCVDSRNKPLIYDFGGKPYATSSTNSTLNFFKNAGSGSKELGVDCSGYVFTSLMSAGLKLSPSKPLRARNVTSIPAKAYKSPGKSMSCIKKVKAGRGFNLQPGDIFASNGHIFIVNLIGDDPLGVEYALKNNSCDFITSDDFNFTVLQSSPNKGATGMNHMDGGDYLATSKTMRRGFEKFARLDCRNKQRNKASTPKISEASLVRHKMTPECVSKKVLTLDHESCVRRCSY